MCAAGAFLAITPPKAVAFSPRSSAAFASSEIPETPSLHVGLRAPNLKPQNPKALSLESLGHVKKPCLDSALIILVVWSSR